LAAGCPPTAAAGFRADVAVSLLSLIAVSGNGPIRGEIVKAFVVLAPGVTPSTGLAVELQEHVKRVTAPYKYPREIEFVGDLPKTIGGKIRRVELRQREKARRQVNAGAIVS
jgi:acyl-coenzyme A synthetase/AMP-(fatty) acid ligase